MKKLFLLAMAFVAVTAFAGCSKDDEAPEINPELIVGKWQYVRTAGYYIENGVREEHLRIITFVGFNNNL